MILTFIKRLLATLWYRPGTTHRILTGPMRGMRFVFTESSGFAALYSGNEKDNQKAYARIVQPGDVIVDAGANWGVHTLYLSLLTGPTGKVLAFEPHPLVASELATNVKLNHLDQVVQVQAALSDQEAELPFLLGSSTKVSHIAGTREQHDGTVVKVPCTTLDRWLAENPVGSIKLIKVDVEGAEAALLRGAEQTILEHRPDLVVELHTPEQDLEVARLLSGWGYQIRRIDGSPISHLDRSWPDPEGVWGTLHATPGHPQVSGQS